jgi:multidrug efflux system membrane fusion protein
MLTASRMGRAAAAALALATAGCAGPAEVPPRGGAGASRPVRVAAVVDSALTRPVNGTGTLGAKDELTLSFKVGGVIARVLVDAGNRVYRGQVLATLERREIDAGVAKALSAEEKASRDVARFERLYADSVVTRVQLQDARTVLTAAAADLDAATFNQRYATIAAPAAGTVLTRKANPGELVSSGTTVLTLASAARGVVVRVGLPDRDVVRVAAGNRAVVRFDAYPDKDFAGSVSEIAAAASPGTGTYPVEIALRGAGTLPNGLVGRVEISPATAHPVGVVPIEAIVEADGGRGTVYVLSGDARHAERRDVTIGFTDGRRVGITAGLRGARAVVTEGAAYLNNGDAVRVLP